MRSFTALVLAAVIGSIATLGIYKAFDLDQPVVIEQETSPMKLASISQTYPNSNVAPVLPSNFTAAANKSMPSVVHIKSNYAINRTQRQGGYGNDFWDPFRDFFGDDFPAPPPSQGNQGQRSPQQGGQRFSQSSGSGVVISGEGLVVTNNHVIEGADNIEVTTFDKRTYTAEVLGTDPTTDIALLKISAPNLEVMNLADSDDVQVGEWVLAVGNPFNLASTVTAGIVSAKGRNINILQDNSAIESFIQTDAAVNPGNSGGALVNINGDLIGINTAIATPTGSYAGYSFAVPVNLMKKVTDDLLTHGVVQRGFLGVNIRDLDTKTATDLGIDISQGVYVDGLLQSGAAEKAGIQVGDVITAVDGIEVNSSPELQEAIGLKRPGDNARVTLNRKGREINVNVGLKNRSGTSNVITRTNNSVIEKLGVSLKDLSAQELRENNISGGVQVVQINSGVIRNSTEMVEGFIITKIDEKEVDDLDTLQSYLSNKRGGILIEGVYPGKTGVYYYGLGL